MTQPQYPQQFGAPVQQPQQFPPQGYPQQMQPMPVQPGYPAQQYNFPVPPQAQPAPQLAAGSLDDFFGQPTVGGGQALKFTNVGDSHTFTVSRVITKADVQQQTDTRNIPQFFKDGRPKFQMIVPATLPDGSAGTWYVKGATREALGAAMTKAGVPGAPQCAPEAGATIRVTYVGDKQNGAGYNPSKLYHVEYARPADAPADNPTKVPQLAPTPRPAAPPLQGLPTQAPAEHVYGGPQVNQGSWSQPLPGPVANTPAAPAPQFAPPVQQAPPGVPAMPEGLTPDQQAGYAQLLAQLGQQPQG
jgi:hypothetical protein